MGNLLGCSGQSHTCTMHQQHRVAHSQHPDTTLTNPLAAGLACRAKVRAVGGTAGASKAGSGAGHGHENA